MNLSHPRLSTGKGKTSKVNASESTMRFRNRRHSANDGSGVCWKEGLPTIRRETKGTSSNGQLLGYRNLPGIELRPNDVVSRQCKTG